MRRIVISLALVVLFSIRVSAYTAQTPPTVTRDPQAVNILNQALNVAGGVTAIKAITDYTASGTITYDGNPDVGGSVTILGLGLNECRLDANLPAGVRSWSVSAGRLYLKNENGTIRQEHSQISMHQSGLVFPYLELAITANSPAYGVVNKGLVEINGRQVYDIQIQQGIAQSRPAPVRDFSARDYFIDASTFGLVMTQDFSPHHIQRQLQYSNYQMENGVLVPFAISELFGGNANSTIQLSQIAFNSGLQASAFTLGAN